MSTSYDGMWVTESNPSQTLLPLSQVIGQMRNVMVVLNGPNPHDPLLVIFEQPLGSTPAEHLQNCVKLICGVEAVVLIECNQWEWGTQKILFGFQLLEACVKAMNETIPFAWPKRVLNEDPPMEKQLAHAIAREHAMSWMRKHLRELGTELTKNH